MNALSLLRRLALLPCLIYLAGCAAEKPKPAARATSGENAAAPGEERNPEVEAMFKEAAAKLSEPFEGDDWQSLFDGQSLTGWRETEFAGRGPVQIRSGLMVLSMGDPFTGVNLTNPSPNM